MTYRGSSGGIETLQIIDKKRRGPRTHVCIPVLILWDEQGQARSEKAQTLTISWFGCAVLGFPAANIRKPTSSSNFFWILREENTPTQ
jgi:hypothetical protein